MNMFKYLILSILFILSFLTACQSDQQTEGKAESGASVFPVTNPILIDTVFSREYVAGIQSIQHVEIRARVQGFLEKIHADEGASVRAGQLLFSLSNKEFREALRKAQAVLNSAVAEAKMSEIEVKNVRNLVEKNIVSESELAMAEAKLEAIQAQIEEAKSDVSAAELILSFTEIRAPFSGNLNREPFKVGSLIEEGDLLTTISGNNDVYAYFSVSEKEYLEMMKRPDAAWKSNLALLLASGQMHTHNGSVETVETVVDKNTGNIAFRARFPNPGQLLKHGSSGKIMVYEELKGVLVIPQKSTFDVQDKTYVYVLDKDDTIQRRAITIKLRLGHLYAVSSGLTTSDRVLYEGIQILREGERIETEQIPLQDIIPTLAIR